jgi:hypothetical protein
VVKIAKKISHVVNVEGVDCGRDADFGIVDIAGGAVEIVTEGIGRASYVR